MLLNFLSGLGQKINVEGNPHEIIIKSCKDIIGRTVLSLHFHSSPCHKVATSEFGWEWIFEGPAIPRVGRGNVWILCCMFLVFPQVCHCVQWHIPVPSPPTCCIMDEAKETEAAGVLTIRKKEKEQSCWLLQTASVLLSSFCKQQLSVSVSGEAATGLLCWFCVLSTSWAVWATLSFGWCVSLRRK